MQLTRSWRVEANAVSVLHHTMLCLHRRRTARRSASVENLSTAAQLQLKRLDMTVNILVVFEASDHQIKYKKLSYRRGTARCVVSIEILPIATQQCRNYLYDKS